VAGNSDLIFRRLMGVIERMDLADDPRMATNGGRCDHAAELDAAIAAWTRTLPAKDAEAALEAAEVPCSRLYDIADCANDPHFVARGLVQKVADPLLGEVLHPAPPFRLDGVAPGDMIRWPGRAAGADNDHVFHELLGEPR
jgi:formyl-CoA transferase